MRRRTRFRMHRLAGATIAPLLAVAPSAGIATEDPEPTLAHRLQERIDAFHADQPANDERLRVVYFHPLDNPPQAGFRERTDRILRDYRDFLQREMRRLGFRGPALPLELGPEGEVKVRVVTGEGGSDAYTYENGDRVKSEIMRALADGIDFDTDFVFVLSGLCQKRGEQDYFFHAPYYGAPGSNQRWGLCYAADCELLDPLNLTEENGKITMKFEEHYGDYRMSIARFNSWYLGGIAHELGHGFSLPHNGELPSQREARGKALMGGGNHTYGEDRWGGGKGTFLTLASALRLASHPLFTGSDRERFADVSHAFRDLEVESVDKHLVLRGSVEASPPPLAVVAYTDPPGNAGYNALTWVGEVAEKDGTFEVDIEDHVASGLHELRLSVLHLNGAVGTDVHRYRTDENGHPDSAELQGRFTIAPVTAAFLGGNREKAASLAREQLASDPPERTGELLTHLASLADPPEPVALDSVKGDSAFLSDVRWERAEVGWGEPARNQYFVNRFIRNAVLLELGGRFFLEGLYAHAPSEYVFALSGDWKRFDATVGLQGGVGPMGRSRFSVVGDGRVLARSKVLKGAETENLEADVTGVDELRLKVETTIPGNPQCWSVWGAPRVRR